MDQQVALELTQVISLNIGEAGEVGEDSMPFITEFFELLESLSGDAELIDTGLLGLSRLRTGIDSLLVSFDFFLEN